MKIVGNCEYGLILYRDKLPKFRNGGKMIFNCIDWPRDNKSEKIHPTQKPVELLEKIINIFTDEGDVVIDPVAGSGSTLIAAENLGRKAYGFEIKKEFYQLATKWIEKNRLIKQEIKEIGYAKTELEKDNITLF
jgi:site-specific DNA-methyltransferase (adenine-specific)